MGKVLLFIGAFVGGLGLLALIYLSFLSILNQRTGNPSQQEFLKGTKPGELSGFYKGTASVKTTWKGKEFDSNSKTGINILGDTKKYPFKIYTGKGLQDNVDVLKIDYNIKENPFWVRLILDELVEIAPNKYLGKAMIRVIPGFPFTVLFFSLSKS